MSSMKDVHADLMDLLEQSVDDTGLDTCACSGEALHAAWCFVHASADQELRVEIVHAAGRGVLADGQVASVPLSALTGLEIRRFAVALDGSHRAHAVRAAAARELGLIEPSADAVGPFEVLGPFEIPTDLRAELLRVFPLPGQVAA